MAKCKALTGSAVKGLNYVIINTGFCQWRQIQWFLCES